MIQDSIWILLKSNESINRKTPINNDFIQIIRIF